MKDELKKVSPETYFHCLHVKKLTFAMLKEVNKDQQLFDQQQVDAICKGALLHDIGKLFVRNSLLTKRSKLTDDERQAMAAHTSNGYGALQAEVSEVEAPIVLDICLYHHEHLDPHQPEEHQLPLYVQIVSVCDAYEALRSDRIYHKGCSKEVAMQMIERGECGYYSPSIINYMKMIVNTAEF